MKLDISRHRYQVVSSKGTAFYMSTLAGACSHLLIRRKGSDKGGYVDDAGSHISRTADLENIAKAEVQAYVDRCTRAAQLRGRVQ